MVQSIEMHIMVRSNVLFGTDSRCLQVRDFKGFIYFLHLLEYISVYVYEWTAEVTTASRALEQQNKKWRHNTGKFNHSWQPGFK